MTTVLLVDDEKMIAEPLVRALARNGYDVLVAHDGLEGLARARTERPDAVILDVLMPEMDGWEVCRALLRRVDLDRRVEPHDDHLFPGHAPGS